MTTNGDRPVAPRRMSFGVLVAPFHPVDENPTLALERDLELIEWLDRLGYDEAWAGEHHSGGWGTIASPELFVAAAAARTRHIRLGTGVVSLPYHHPLMVADRMVLLDHLTRGRVMFGVGAGVLPSDAHMIGVEPMRQRAMLEEALDAIVLLLTREEPISIDAGWFTLRDAALQLRPYTRPHMPLAVASSASPSGMRLAGKHGAMVLSLAAFAPGGLAKLRRQWEVAEEAAAEHGTSIDRQGWRIVLPVHLADTREEAMADVRAGGRRLLVDYFKNTLGRPLDVDPSGDGLDGVDAMIRSGQAIVGDPDDCYEAILRIQELCGGFGGLLTVALDWAPREKVLRSFELLARYVAPRLQGSLAGIERSQRWAAENRDAFFAQSATALGSAMAAPAASGPRA